MSSEIVIVEGDPRMAPSCAACGESGSIPFGLGRGPHTRMEWKGRISEDRHLWRCPNGHLTSGCCVELTALWGACIIDFTQSEPETVEIVDVPTSGRSYFKDPALRAQVERGRAARSGLA